MSDFTGIEGAAPYYPINAADLERVIRSNGGFIGMGEVGSFAHSVVRILASQQSQIEILQKALVRVMNNENP